MTLQTFDFTDFMTNIIFVYGTDSYRSGEALREIIVRYKDKNNGDMNCVVLDGASLAPQVLEHHCMSIPFCAPKRLVVVMGALESNNKNIIDLLPDLLPTIPDTTLCVIYEPNDCDKRLTVYKMLLQSALVKHFKPLTPLALRRWCDDHVATRSATITPDARDQLLATTGPDLYRLTNAIETLRAYNPSITKETVSLLVPSAVSSVVFDLIDSVVAHNQQKALSVLDTLRLQGENTFGLFALLAGTYRTCIGIALAHNAGITQPFAIAKTIKAHPFVVSKSLGFVKKTSLTHLVRSLRLFTYYDSAIKHGIMDEVTAFDMLVVALCKT